MKQFLSQHKDWVIDGNYSWCCYEERNGAKPTTLSFSTSLVGTASIEPGNDTVVIRGRVHESMAAGCPERFDWEFIRWILWDGRTKNAKERYRNIRSTYPDKFISLKNQKELDAFLKQYNKKVGIKMNRTPKVRQKNLTFGVFLL